MDVNDIRIAVTMLSLIAFLGLMVWAGLSRNRRPFEEAALLPFADEPGGPRP